MDRYTVSELLAVMAYSLTRFLVFSFQYYLVIHLLLPELAFFEMMMTVTFVYYLFSRHFLRSICWISGYAVLLRRIYFCTLLTSN